MTNTSNEIVSEEQNAADAYFGVCPMCKSNDGYLNLGGNHWCKCDTHKVKWWIGGNIFSDWRDESEEDWDTNAALLETYVEVEPYYPPMPTAEKSTPSSDNVLKLFSGFDNEEFPF